MFFIKAIKKSQPRRYLMHTKAHEAEQEALRLSVKQPGMRIRVMSCFPVAEVYNGKISPIGK